MNYPRIKFINTNPNITSENFQRIVSIWRKQEDYIMPKIVKESGLTFSEKEIVIEIVDNIKGGTSNPFRISSKIPNDKVINLITHELIHRILTFNTEWKTHNDFIRGKYIDESNLVRIHIVVNTILKDVLPPEKVQKDIAWATGHYKRAWNLVNDTM